jgi:CubicO group peptidase (beta-lactamase class C family)
VLALEAAGYSDLAAKKLMRTDAIFDIRSISKPITVLGALLLVDDWKLTLGDPLAKFLPEFSHLTVKGQAQPTNVPITLRQLMMHTSGIADEPLIRIYLTHYFLGDFREANPVMNAAFPE